MVPAWPYPALPCCGCGHCPSVAEVHCHRASVQAQQRDRKTHGQESPASSLAVSWMKTCSRKEQAQNSMRGPLGGAGECTGQGSLEEQLIEEQHAGKGFSQWLTGCDLGSPAMAVRQWRSQGPVVAQSSPELALRAWRIAGKLLALILVMKRHSNRVGGLANKREGKQAKTKVFLFPIFLPGYHQKMWPRCRVSESSCFK